MDYDLAKQLKEKGFPQIVGNGIFVYEERGEYCGLPEKEHEEKCDDYDCKDTKPFELYIPSLEELIEACGDEFDSLDKIDKDSYSARSPRDIKGGYEAFSIYEEAKNDWQWGKTPTEAVAKLYIKLHE